MILNVSDPLIHPTTPSTWTNYHGNVGRLKVNAEYAIVNPSGPIATAPMRQTIAAIQALFTAAIGNGSSIERLRVLGGEWSLSQAAWTDGSVIATNRNLNWWSLLKSADLLPSFRGPRDGVVFTQCGMPIGILNAELKAKGRSLRATGASNGQTIVGAMSTGTHGSAFDNRTISSNGALVGGSLHDHVVAIQIVTAPDECVWLERASYPVATESFAKEVGSSRIVRDDAQFNSALVSFGSFGFIHAILIETEPRYLLHTHRSKVNVDNDFRDAIMGPDPAKINIHSTNVIDGEPVQLYHFEWVLNPYHPSTAWVTTMYKGAYLGGYQPPDPNGGDPGPDLLAVLGWLQHQFPQPINVLLDLFSSQFYDSAFEHTGTIGEIFYATDPKGQGTSMEIAFAPSDASRVLDAVIAVHANFPVGGICGFRYIAASNATLAMTGPFGPVACTLEIESLNNTPSQQFQNAFWDELDKQGIRYTFHWGQVNNFNGSTRTAASLYGADKVKIWTDARSALLNPQMLKVFESPFLSACGL